MPAYLIAEHKVIDRERFDEYLRQVRPVIAKFGGRYLTKPGSHQILEEGVWQPERVVIIEFPDMATWAAFYRSPEYQPLIALRTGASVDMMITLEGA